MACPLLVESNEEKWKSADYIRGMRIVQGQTIAIRRIRTSGYTPVSEIWASYVEQASRLPKL
jgi:hypothetical protein